MFAWRISGRVLRAALITAVVGCAGVAPVAWATTHELKSVGVQREGNPGNFEYGYQGPQFVVASWGDRSTDTYDCPIGSGQRPSTWVVVPNVQKSADRWYYASAQPGQHEMHVTVTS